MRQETTSWGRWVMAAGIVALTAMTLTAARVDQAFNVGSGYWTNPASWTGTTPRVPTIEDIADIGYNYSGKSACTCIVDSAATSLAVRLGNGAGKYGLLIVTNDVANLNMPNGSIYIGYSGGTGIVRQYGGLVTPYGCKIGSFDGIGTYELAGGILSNKIDVHIFQVGPSGWGTFRQTGGTNILRSQTSASIGGSGADNFTAGTGTYELVNGLCALNMSASSYFLVGRKGSGTFTQTGGTLTDNTNGSSHTIVMKIGGGVLSGDTGGHGVYNFWGGALDVYMLSLGDCASDGSGTLNMSNTTVAITGLIVRNQIGASGTLRGCGTAGAIRMNGQCIADGYGVDQTLTISSFYSDKTTSFTYSSTNGWFAENHGKLLLPVKTFASTLCWGDLTTCWNNTTTNQPLVNAVKMVFTGGSGNLTGSLLASDHGSVSNGLNKPVGIWDFSGTTFSTGALTIRYDDLKATSLGIKESNLKVVQYVNGAWTNITTGINPTTKQITANAVSPISQIAVDNMPARGTLISIR